MPLSPPDWHKAALRAIAEQGARGLAIEPLARRLGATKGSFYWHFRNLAALKAGLLAHWRAATEAALSALPPGEGAPRIAALIGQAVSPDEAMGGAALEPALRDWARYDGEVATALRAVDSLRLTLLTEAMAQAGIRAPEQAARMLYAAHIGLAALRLAGHPLDTREHAATLARQVELLRR